MAESNNSANGDTLHIGDLLVGTNGNPDQSVAYLHFTFDPSTNATIVELASQPDAAAALVQKVVLSGVDLTALGTYDSEIISHLLSVTGSPHGDA